MNNRLNKNCYGWLVVGNEDYAFAACDNDIQYFTRDPDVNNDAFIRALGWCYQNPPDKPKNWTSALALHSRKEQTKKLIDQFCEQKGCFVSFCEGCQVWTVHCPECQQNYCGCSCVCGLTTVMQKWQDSLDAALFEIGVEQ